MSPAPPIEPTAPAAQADSVAAKTAPPRARPTAATAWLTWGAVGIAAIALVASLSMWQKLSNLQEQLARQSADSGAQAIEARTLARQAHDQAQDAVSRVSLTETRLSEVALQRGQLEDLIQSLSRSRDDNLVVDIESSLRLAQQQAQLTGSVEPLLAGLKSAEQRIGRAAQPRLAPLQRAIVHDADRIRAASGIDTPGLLSRLDELTRQVDDIPIANAVAPMSASRIVAAPATPGTPHGTDPVTRAKDWWDHTVSTGVTLIADELRQLVRVSRIDQPEAALLSPEQSFFLRENLKLKLLNARLGVLARQLESARADINAATLLINKYFDPSSRKTQVTAALLQTVQAQLKLAELPHLDETLTALAIAAAGR